MLIKKLIFFYFVIEKKIFLIMIIARLRCDKNYDNDSSDCKNKHCVGLDMAH